MLPTFASSKLNVVVFISLADLQRVLFYVDLII